MQNLSDKIRGKQRIVLPGEGVSGSAGLFLGVGLFHRIDEARQFLDRAVDVIALATQQRDTILAFLDRDQALRSEEHTSELKSLMRISYAVFCLKKKKKKT